ncbi:Probable NOT transcription complex subunit vip2 [Ancistrocladus abbreviatus]
MSGLLNSSRSGSASDLLDSDGGTFAAPFSTRSGAAAPVFRYSGAVQGLHNMQGTFNVPSMPGTLTSRNSTMNSVTSGGAQQAAGNLSTGRFASNNLPVALSQISHGSSLGHSGVTNRGGMSAVGNPGYASSTNGVGGSIPGILSSSAIGNRDAVPGLGTSPILGNAGPRITSSMGSMVDNGSIGRNIISGGGLSVPGLASHLNPAANSGAVSLGVQGPNRLMSGMLQQASPQVISMLRNSYTSLGGPLSQNRVQAVNSLSSMGVFSDVNSSDSSPFDINDFPVLTSRPNSSGGSQGQIGPLRKQGLGVSPIAQTNQEFSMQSEDFPALPGFKGGNADYGMDLHQKEQLHDNGVSMMQSQHFPNVQMGRSAGFNIGSTYSSRRPQQHTLSANGSTVSFSGVNHQDLVHLRGSDIFPSSNSMYHLQSGGLSGIGLRAMNSNTVSSMNSYEQLMQHESQPQFHLQQMSAVNQSFRDQGIKPLLSQAAPDRFGLLGLLSVTRMSDQDLTSLALGIDLTTLGLNLNSTEDLYKTFGSPWSNEPAKGDPEFVLPQCYCAKEPPPLHQGYFSKLRLEALFYIFYSMPKDETQLYAANELYNRGWFYHRDHRMWYTRAANMEPLVKTNAYERGRYLCFDPNTWETVAKDNFVLHYESLEKRPTLHQH